MQITAPSITPGLPETATSTSSQQNKAASLAADRPAKRPVDGANKNETADTPESTLVTLSTMQSTPQAGDNAIAVLPPVYAEIWKNGVKVASVDANGGVSAINGFIAPAQGSEGGGGELLAARRAAEIARAIGGEIHVTGQSVDPQTLAMRAKLNAAYGIRN